MESSELTELQNANSEAASLQRRDFLSILGASFAALGLSACDLRAPKETVVPYLQEVEGYVPGVANWFASTCSGCSAACGILAKTREGRPIKLEGNPEHPLSQGGLCARGQAVVLDLYDSVRFKGPKVDDTAVSWENVDQTIKDALAEVSNREGAIRLLSSTVHSPTMARAIELFLEAYPGSRHIAYDSLSSSSILDAHYLTHGTRTLPWYRFDKAKVIVGFDADFLGTWISPVQFTRDWATGRTLGENHEWMSHHVQFEPRMSLTGSNADQRIRIRPSDMASMVAELARGVGVIQGKSIPAYIESIPKSQMADAEIIGKVARELANEPGRGLVVCGSSDASVQAMINFINDALGNYGETLDLTRPSLQRQGDDGALQDLITEMNEGRVDALIMFGANPVYDQVSGKAFGEAMARVGTTVSLSDRSDETSAVAQIVCPDHHSLESWGDAHPRMGVYSLLQPMMGPLYETRAACESLLAWAGRDVSAYDFLREVWREKIHPLDPGHGSFEPFWIKSLQDGVCVIESEVVPAARYRNAKIAEPTTAFSGDGADGQFELVVYPSVALADGRQANNPWLQELPDPISKVAWGNYASVSPEAAERLGAMEGRIVQLRAADLAIQVPLHVQPGMIDGVVAVALGYGRNVAGKVAANFPTQKMFGIEKELLGGANAYPLLQTPHVSIQLIDGFDPLAKSQTYDIQTLPFLGTMRPQIQEIELEEIEHPTHDDHEEGHSDLESLWPEHEYPGHKWAMSIDLNKCTGCAACVVGCQAENNVPVVGKAEFRKNREMHWIRIDRYYSGSEEGPSPDPRTNFQPMLCQHCDNAPCETVCPVLATVHSSEGLNMQVYNRCVGTRYCANNCPYKVRRFNWFDYAHQDLVQNLVLNPDITIRTRGIMEKCSFCVQRIQDVKHQAALEGRVPDDNEIKPACAQSCPSQAIIFGDINNAESSVAKLRKDARSYAVIPEIGTGPAVSYLKKVRNEKA